MAYFNAPIGGLFWAPPDSKAELHIVLPFAKQDFYDTSVDYGLKAMAEFRVRFDEVLQQSDLHYATTEKYLGDDALFEFNAAFAQGLALIRADQLGVEPIALTTVNRSAPAVFPDFLRCWKERSFGSVHFIDLEEIRTRILPKNPAWFAKDKSSATFASEPRPNRKVRAMLFADVKGVSEVTEQQLPRFILHWMNILDREIAASTHQPLHCNTWGDGVFLVFESVTTCADFATRIVTAFEKMDWTTIGAPADTNVRIGVHNGPVYEQLNPLLHRSEFHGSHVNRAARIEPLTTPGTVFASEQFAAFLTLESQQEFAIQYEGAMRLAKSEEPVRLYRVASANDWVRMLPTSLPGPLSTHAKRDDLMKGDRFSAPGPPGSDVPDPDRRGRRNLVFISYSHHDKRWLVVFRLKWHTGEVRLAVSREMSP